MRSVRTPTDVDDPDDPTPDGPAGARALAWRDPSPALPLSEAIPPAWRFRIGLHGYVVPVCLDTDFDGDPDTTVTVGWKAGEGDGEARPRVTDIRPIDGHRTAYRADLHEGLAVERSREWLTSPRLKEAA